MFNPVGEVEGKEKKAQREQASLQGCKQQATRAETRDSTDAPLVKAGQLGLLIPDRRCQKVLAALLQRLCRIFSLPVGTAEHCCEPGKGKR